MVVRANPSWTWTSTWYFTSDSFASCPYGSTATSDPPLYLPAGTRGDSAAVIRSLVQSSAADARGADATVSTPGSSSWPVVSFWSRPETSTLPWVTSTPVPASLAETANLVPRAVTDRFGVSTRNRSASDLAGAASTNTSPATSLRCRSFGS